MSQVEKLWEFLQRLTPLSRTCLLSELERLELCGVDMPGSTDIQARLRAEFASNSPARSPTPSSIFFAPLELLLIDGAPEHANTGRISRKMLVPIWEWICRDLLPTMARDYIKAVNDQVAANNLKELQKTASAFQVKVVKVLENTLASAEGIELARAMLARYTASRTAFDDVSKMLLVLRSSDALTSFAADLPASITRLEEPQLAQIAAKLETFRKGRAAALPFALALVARRLKTPWQLIRLATRMAPTKQASAVAATPYAIAVGMTLDHLDDKRLALRVALRTNRVLIARDLLGEIDAIEHALRTHIEQLEQSEWGHRLQQLLDAIAALVAAEVSRFPANVGHVLGSRRGRRRSSLLSVLTDLACTGRDAVQDGASAFRRMIGQT